MLELPMLIEELLKEQASLFWAIFVFHRVTSQTVKNLSYVFLQGKVYFSALLSFVCIAREAYHGL